MKTPLEIKPGTSFAVLRGPRGNRLERVTIERLTKTQAVDTKGNRWRLKDGIEVGAKPSGWSVPEYLEIWTDQHEQRMRADLVVSAYSKALLALDALKQSGPSILEQALPHLRAAIKAARLAGGQPSEPASPRPSGSRPPQACGG